MERRRGARSCRLSSNRGRAILGSRSSVARAAEWSVAGIPDIWHRQRVTDYPRPSDCTMIFPITDSTNPISCSHKTDCRDCNQPLRRDQNSSSSRRRCGRYYQGCVCVLEPDIHPLAHHRQARRVRRTVLGVDAPVGQGGFGIKSPRIRFDRSLLEQSQIAD